MHQRVVLSISAGSARKLQSLAKQPCPPCPSIVAEYHVTASSPSFTGRVDLDPGRFQSASFGRLLARARLFARDRHATILLEGESGTGKTLLARYLHGVSPRATKPYQTVVLSTIEDTLAASELFGHVSGAYTDARHSRAGHFASANGGTLFLDEIGKASLAVQQRLLHVVEYGEFRPVGSDRDMRVDVRIIAATNLKLDDQVERQRFLPDLHARLSVFSLTMPSLRERRADIPILVEEAVARHALNAGYTAPPTVDDDLMAALQAA